MKWLTCIILLLASCRKEETQAYDAGYDFYPTSLLTERVYKVDSIVFNDFTQTTDTFRYFLRERLEEVYTSGDNQAVRVQQYLRKSELESWKKTKIWAFSISARHVEELTDNLRTHALLFPVKEGETWNSNRPNTRAEEINTCKSVASETIGGRNFTSVAHIKRREIQDALKINTDIAFDKYAKGVGLVYRHRENLKRFTTGIPGETPVDSGLIYILTIHTFDVK